MRLHEADQEISGLQSQLVLCRQSPQSQGPHRELLDAANYEIDNLKNKLAEAQAAEVELEAHIARLEGPVTWQARASPPQKRQEVSELQSQLDSSALEIQYLKDKMEILQLRGGQARASPPQKLQEKDSTNGLPPHSLPVIRLN